MLSSLAGHQWIPPQKEPGIRKVFPLHDAIMGRFEKIAVIFTLKSSIIFSSSSEKFEGNTIVPAVELVVLPE